MTAANKRFVEFVERLMAQGIVDQPSVDAALVHLDGMGGVIADQAFTLGYEAIAREMGRRMQFHQLVDFVRQNKAELAEDSGARYFFAQALLDDPEMSDEERQLLIGLMPEQYRGFLRRRFG